MGKFDHFKGQLPIELIEAMEAEIEQNDIVVDSDQRLNDLEYQYVSREDILHLYANASTGSDSNDGLAADSAKATVQGVFDIMPHVIEGLVVVNLSGAFTQTATDYYSYGSMINGVHAATPFDRELHAAIIVDGGDVITVTDDNSGNDYQSTGVTTSSLTLSGAGWTADEHLGKMLELTDTDQAGTLCGVLYNTTDTIYFIRPITLPSGNPKFRFVEPGTSIQSLPSGLPGDSWGRYIGATGVSGGNYYNLRFQRLTLIDTGLRLDACPGLAMWGSQLVCRLDSYPAHPLDINYESSMLAGGFTPGFVEPTTGIFDAGGVSRWADVCGVSSNSTYSIRSVKVNRLSLYGVGCKSDILIKDCGLAGLPHYTTGDIVIDGCRPSEYDRDYKYSRVQLGIAKSLKIFGSYLDISGPTTTSNHPTPTIDGSADHGIEIRNSVTKFVELSVSNSANDAIRILDESKVTFLKAITGSGNTGFSLNVGEGCSVVLEDTNTITSTAGEISFDGTNEATTFSAVEGGASAISPKTNSLVRNSTPIEVLDTDVINGGSIASYGEIYAKDNSTATSFGGTGESNKSQVTIFDTNGVGLDATPDHTNDHITIGEAGVYRVSFSIVLTGTASQEIGFAVYKNNGATAFDNLHEHLKLNTNGDAKGGRHGLITLAAGDTLELWCWNETLANDITISDAVLSIDRVG